MFIKKVSSIVAILFLFASLATSVSAATINLNSYFDIEGDDMIHFGDQTTDSSSPDPTPDYLDQTTVRVTFDLELDAYIDGNFHLIIDHLQSNSNMGYNN